MKYLLVFAVVLIGFWAWRNGRRQSIAKPKPAPAAAPAQVGPPLEMARCAVCALHLPQADALPGKAGWYCSAEHLKLAER